MNFKSVALFVAIIAITSNLRAASLTVVPNLFEGKFPMIQQLMPDGNSVMGVAGNEVFRWTPAEGRESLGLLGPDVNIIPTAISADGTTIVGRRIGNYSQEAIRWTVDSGLEVLPTVGSHSYNPSPSHVSDDGRVIYGKSFKKFTQPVLDLYTLGLIPYPYFVSTEGNQEVPFRWEASAGTEVLASWLPDSYDLFGGNRKIRAVSADGSAVAGMVGRAPVIWSETTGFQQPASLPTDDGSSSVNNLSADGSTLVGKYYASDCRYQPTPSCMPGAVNTSAPFLFRWTIGGELEPLTDSTESYIDVYAVSSDGQTILGSIDPQGDEQGYQYIWRAGNGMRNIIDYFADHGLVIPFPGYHSISEMSRDGLVFMGSTSNPTGVVNGQPTSHTTRWIVDLRNVVPEPGASGLAVAATCIFGVGVRARRTVNWH